MAESGVCPACFTGTLEVQAGLLVCDACGRVVTGFTQEAQEYNETAGPYVRSQRVAAAPREAQPVQERRPLPIAGGVQAYVAAVQQLLQAQAAALAADFGVDPAVADAVKEIWFAFLPGTGVLEPGFVRDLEAKARQETTAASGGKSAHLATWNLPAKMVEDELNRVLPVSITLSIALLACFREREAVSPLDIVRWALDGHLPYLDFARRFREQLEPFSGVLASALVAPAGTPPPSTVLNRAVGVAHRTGLACPQVNVGLWLERYVAALELPKAVLALALELYALYRIDSPAFSLQPNVALHPWAHVMALVLVAVNFLYSLDGARGKARPPEWELPDIDWLQWAHAAMERCHGLSLFSMTQQEAMALDGVQAGVYIDMLRKHVFGGNECPNDLREYQALFDRIAAMEEVEAQALAAPAAQDRVQVALGPGAAPAVGEDPVGTYSFYGGPATAAGAALAPLPAHYTAVLLVCAAHVWLVPRALRDIVAQLERDMMEAEATVAAKHSVPEQALQRRMEELGALR